MLIVATVLTTIHGLVRWAAILVASWALGLRLFTLFRGRGLPQVERPSLVTLTGVIHAQVVLGGVIAVLAWAGGAPPFAGSTSTLIGHALGGVLMAAAATLAVATSQRLPQARMRAAWTTLFDAATWLLLGKFALSAPLVAAAVIVAVLVERRLPQPALRDTTHT